MCAPSSALLSGLSNRGLISNCTDLAGLDSYLEGGGKVAIYCGYDATADSLHVGSLISMLVLQAFGDAGHILMPLCGTGTAMIGDPTGRSSSRPMLDDVTMERNAAGVERSLRLVLGERGTVLRNDWLLDLGLVDFLREVGQHIPLSRVIKLDAVATRLDSGISWQEAAYPMLQAYDFLHLARIVAEQGLRLVQIGGSDQWGNICTGLELISKAEPSLQAWGLTVPLLTKADGTKMGKTVDGAVWLDPAKLSHVAFWNFWRDVEDLRLPELLSTFGLPPLQSGDAASLNAAKSALADHVTTLVRGARSAQDARVAMRAALVGEASDALPRVILQPGDSLVKALVVSGLASSNSDAVRLIQGGGVRLANEKVSLTHANRPFPPLNHTSSGQVLSVGQKRSVVVDYVTDFVIN